MEEDDDVIKEVFCQMTFHQDEDTEEDEGKEYELLFAQMALHGTKDESNKLLSQETIMMNNSSTTKIFEQGESNT